MLRVVGVAGAAACFATAACLTGYPYRLTPLGGFLAGIFPGEFTFHAHPFFAYTAPETMISIHNKISSVSWLASSAHVALQSATLPVIMPERLRYLRVVACRNGVPASCEEREV